MDISGFAKKLGHGNSKQLIRKAEELQRRSDLQFHSSSIGVVSPGLQGKTATVFIASHQSLPSFSIHLTKSYEFVCFFLGWGLQGHYLSRDCCLRVGKPQSYIYRYIYWFFIYWNPNHIISLFIARFHMIFDRKMAVKFSGMSEKAYIRCFNGLQSSLGVKYVIFLSWWMVITFNDHMFSFLIIRILYWFMQDKIGCSWIRYSVWMCSFDSLGPQGYFPVRFFLNPHLQFCYISINFSFHQLAFFFLHNI